MPTRPRLNGVLLLLAASLLWTGCDSSGTSTSESAPAVQFTQSTAGVLPTDSTATIDLELTNPDADAVSVEVLFAEAASSASSEVLGGVPTVRTITFPEGADSTTTRSFEVEVFDVDDSEGFKEAFFALQQLQTDGGARIESPREFTLNIGFPPLADLRSTGASGLFAAIVTEVSGDDARVQDGPAAIAVTRREDFTSDVQQGDRVSITGTVSEFANQLQIDTDDLRNYEVLSSGNELPDPVQLSVPEAKENFSEYENERVRVEGLTIDPDGDDTFQAGGSEGNYTATDNEGNEITIRIPGDSFYSGKPIPEEAITFEGVLSRFFEDVQLRARYEGDISEE